MELNESLRRRREELRGKLESLDAPIAAQDDSVGDLETRQRELETLLSNIEDLQSRAAGRYYYTYTMDSANPQTGPLDLDEEIQTANTGIQSATEELEALQVTQTEDGRGASKHQKSTERYLAKRQLLTSRKEECNKNIRDLGVLPEEAFEKYTNLKLERVRLTL